MSIKIAMLKSGEDVIADIKEISFHDEGGVVGYHLSNPYLVKLYESNITLSEGDIETSNGYDIVFTPWAPLSQDKEFNILSDWVVTIYEPHEDVKSSYVNKMEKTHERSSDSIDQ